MTTEEKEIYENALRLLQLHGADRWNEEEWPQQLQISQEKYQELFGDKAGMVNKLTAFDLEQSSREEQEIIDSSANAVEALLTLIQRGIHKLQDINPIVIKQIQVDYPEAWQIYLRHSENHSYFQNYDLVNRGVVEQVFRKDLNLELVTKIILAQSTLLFNAAMFPPDRYNLAEVFRSIYLYYIRGLCTDKGSKILEDYFAQLKF